MVFFYFCLFMCLYTSSAPLGGSFGFAGGSLGCIDDDATTTISGSGGGSLGIDAIIGIGVAGMFGFVLIVVVVMYIIHKRRNLALEAEKYLSFLCTVFFFFFSFFLS